MIIEHKQFRHYMQRIAEANPIYAAPATPPSGTSAPIAPNTTGTYVHNINSLWDIEVLQIVGHLEVNEVPPGDRQNVLVAISQGGTGVSAEQYWFQIPVMWDSNVGDGYHPFCLKRLQNKILPPISTIKVAITNNDLFNINAYLYLICQLKNFEEIIRWQSTDLFEYTLDFNVPANGTQLLALNVDSDAPFILKQITTRLQLIQNLRINIYQRTQGAGNNQFSEPVQMCTIAGHARYPGLRNTLNERVIYMDRSSEWAVEFFNDSAVAQTGQISLQGEKLYVDRNDIEEYEKANNKQFEFYEQIITPASRRRLIYTNE